MKIEKLELSDDKASMILSGVDAHHVNALRRALIVNVPKLAIDKVEIHLGTISDEDGRTYESTTPLFDEIISHRLGLIPIPTDLQLFTYQSECSCEGEGCSDCEIMYSLNKRGPCTVYSRDLDPLGDEKLRPKDPDIPIVRWENPFRPVVQGHGVQWHDDEIGVAGCLMSLVDAVRHDTEPSYGPLQARLDQELILAIRQSSLEKGTPIRIST